MSAIASETKAIKRITAAVEELPHEAQVRVLKFVLDSVSLVPACAPKAKSANAEATATA